ncbi:MAG: thioredoxin family protein [Alphaproteobacteria bacterium]|nr:thioredoxin family protein [Alphaproteobacteria bacterium]
MRKLLLGIALLFGMLNCSAAYAGYSLKSTENTSIQLYHNGKDEVLAEFTIQPDWHISWSNPGDVGQPTEVTAVNTTIEVLEQSIPVARTVYDFMHEYLYENKAYYSLRVNNLNDAEITFNFVECNDVCKPETLTFKLAEIAASDKTQWGMLRQRAKETFPQKITLISPTDENLLQFDTDVTNQMYFAPTQKNIIDEMSINIEETQNGVNVRWQSEQPQQLKQALLLTPDNAYLINIEYENTLSLKLLYMILLAFIGGIILNAMPCVFPILSLKIFTLLKKPQTGIIPYKNALFYTLGVVLSFIILALIMLWLKTGGNNIGWGFQLQTAWFVGIMAAVFFLLFLFMTDILHFPNFGGNFIHRLSGLNEFTTGFFAVLVASPCAGPFMGAAIGYAFMRTNTEVIAIFTALAFGYALPYALIEMFPQALHRILPKPGAWMQKLKIILSIPILITAIWLGSIFYTQIKTDIYTADTTELDWQPFDADKIAELNAKGRNIFVDFTADWCLTCQFNERFILKSQKFKEFVQENDVALFVADLTEHQEDLGTALSSYGRDAIPLYVYYHQGNYQILPLFFRVNSLPK